MRASHLPTNHDAGWDGVLAVSLYTPAERSPTLARDSGLSVQPTDFYKTCLRTILFSPLPGYGQRTLPPLECQVRTSTSGESGGS